MCEKHDFFAVREGRGTEQREARVSCGFQHHNGENLSCFLFSDPILLIVGLRSEIAYLVLYVACRGDAMHAGPSDTLFELAWNWLIDACTKGVPGRCFRSNSFAINLVEARGELPAAGPVACGGLWVMTAVDSSSSAVI